MAYNFLTDFVGLWRATTGGVEKAEMPGLDFVVAALGRAGILNLVISGSPPVVNQATTAWFKPAVPDYAAEGVLYLWNGTMYVPATPGLFYTFLSVSLGASGLAIWLVTGAPSDLVGNNGDIALRTDAPGGIYGPKAAGSWPADPLPGTSYSQISDFLDVLGTAQGDIIYRDAGNWAVLAPGTNGQLLQSGGAAANPSWASSSAVVSEGLDAIGNVQGDILYRNATVWTVLAPGAAGQLLQTGGVAANPSWVSAAAAYVLNSAKVDAAFGATAGGVLVRGAAWTNSGAGAAGQVLTSNGAAAPTFQNPSVTSAGLDALFGGVQGSILYRNATAWVALAPGVSGQFLKTNGTGANPAWANTTVAGAGGIGTYAIIRGGGTGDYGSSFVANGAQSFGESGVPVPNGQTWVSVGLSGVGTLGVSMYLYFRTA
jgi:hypothetical protein